MADLAAKEHRCPRCGTELKVEIVKRRIALEHRHAMLTPEAEVSYEECEEVSDCPRCTGSY